MFHHKKYLLRKYKGLGVVSVMAGLLIGGVSSEVFAEEVPNVDKQNAESCVCEATTQELNRVTEELSNSLENIEKTTNDLKVVSDKLDDLVTQKNQLESIKEQATDENKNKLVQKISQTQYEINQIDTEIKVLDDQYIDKKSALVDQENNVTRAKQSVENIAQNIIQTEKEIEDKQKEINKESFESITNLDNAKARQDELTQSLTVAQQNLEVSKKADTDHNQQIADLTREKSDNQLKLDAEKVALEQAKTKMAEVLLTQKQAQDKLTQAENAVNAINTFIISPEYARLIKEYVTIGSDRKAVTEKLAEESQKLKPLNVYKHDLNASDTKYNIDQLPNDVQKELSLFAMDIINQIREQVGTKPTIVTQSSIDFANKIANRYRQDNYDAFYEVGHYNKAIIDVAREYGFPEGQYYENWAGHSRIKQEMTMDELKSFVYDSISRFVLNNHEFDHAQSIVGVNFGRASEEEYLGIDFSTYPHYAGTHFLTISKRHVEGSKKQIFDTTQIQSSTNSQTILEAYKTAKADLEKINASVNTIAEEVTIAQKNYDKTNSEMISINTRLEGLQKYVSKTAELEKIVTETSQQLATIRDEVSRLQKIVADLSDSIQSKKNSIDSLKNQVVHLRDDLTQKETQLKEEQTRLNSLNDELVQLNELKESKLASRKMLEAELNKLQDELNVLENVDGLYNNSLEAISIESERVDKLMARLNELKQLRDTLKEKYDHLYLCFTIQEQAKNQKNVTVVDNEKSHKPTAVNSDRKGAVHIDDNQLPKTGTDDSRLGALGLSALVVASGMYRRKKD